MQCSESLTHQSLSHMLIYVLTWKITLEKPLCVSLILQDYNFQIECESKLLWDFIMNVGLWNNCVKWFYKITVKLVKEIIFTFIYSSFLSSVANQFYSILKNSRPQLQFLLVIPEHGSPSSPWDFTFHLPKSDSIWRYCMKNTRTKCLCFEPCTVLSCKMISCV